jgi:hypothetical protein
LGTGGSAKGTISFRRCVRNPTHGVRLSTEPEFNRHPEKPTVIDRAWENYTLHDLQDQRNKIQELAMPTRRESTRARDRLQLATPISDDASLSKLEKEVAETLREAKRRDLSGPDEPVSPLIDAVARNYFRHILRKQARLTPLRNRARA